MNTSAADLRTLITTWPDLNDALGAPPTIGGFGRGLRAYMAALDETDLDAAAELRALERDPAQIGQRPIPIRLSVYETMRTVQAALVEVADQIAAIAQRPAMSYAPKSWPANDKRRRDQLAHADIVDPRRWHWTGTPPTAPYAALWLLGRVQATPGPFKPLTAAQHQHIGHVAAESRRRIEHILDTGSQTATLTPPCPDCGGTITVHGGAGSSPLANCGQCGGIWTELGAAA